MPDVKAVFATCRMPLCIHATGATPETFPPPEGLGDTISTQLKRIGITQETYQAAKKKVGLKETCGCQWRQKLANTLGKMIGLSQGQGAELQQIIALDDIPKQPVHECGVYGRCLPQLRVPEEHLIIIREQIQPCQGCPSFTPQEKP